ncbi:Rz1-like lysis system protein LysC [Vibrio vulnificus]
MSAIVIASISGCSSIMTPEKEVVFQIEYLPMLPPPALLAPCISPFDEPPTTHSEQESAIRDVTWSIEFDKCAVRPDKIKQWYQSKQADK